MINASYDKEFVFHDGRRAKNILELYNIIESLSDEEFSRFVNAYKNDFANWINDVLNDADLASKLRLTVYKPQTLLLINSVISELDSKNIGVNKSASSQGHTIPDVHDVRNTSDVILVPPVPTKKKTFFGTGLFKKKTHESHESTVSNVPTADITTRVLSEPFTESITEQMHDSHPHQSLHHESSHEIHKSVNEQEHASSHVIHHHEHDSNHEHHMKGKDSNSDIGSAENLLWMVLYGLVILFIIIILLYKFVFQ